MNRNLLHTGVFASMVLLAIIASSCAKVTVNRPEVVIGYDAVVGKQTKAPILGSIYETDAPDFGVYALYVPNGTWAVNGTQSIKYVDNATCTYNSDKQIWVSDPKAYWPKSGSLTFVAYSPKYYGNDHSNPLLASYDVAKTSLVLTAFDVRNQDDLLYTKTSSACDLTDNGEYYVATGADSHETDEKGVPIVFNHALSLVNVTLSSSETDLYENGITINCTSLKVVGIYQIGTCTVKNDACTWSGQYQAANEGISVDTDDPDNMLLVIPQPFYSGRQKIEVEYTMMANVNGVDVPCGSAKRSVDLLKDDSFKAFEPGKKYTIDIVVGVNEMNFNCNVEDWIPDSNNDLTT